MGLEKLAEILIAGDWAGAEALLEPLAVRPDAHPSLVYNWGKVLIELDRPGEAARALRRVVAADPTHVNGWFELGRAAVLREDYETAYDAFEQAHVIDPDDADATRNFARVALRLGCWDEARDAWEALLPDWEAEIALYRIATETRGLDAGQRRATLLETHPDRHAVVMALVRTSKGAIPLDLRRREDTSA